MEDLFRFEELSKASIKEAHSMGFQYWGGVHSKKQYIKECSNEDKHGKRFGMIDNKTGIIASSMLVLEPIKTTNMYRIGSLITREDYQKKGLATQLLLSVIDHYRLIHPNSFFIGFSEINPSFYQTRMGFRILPNKLQRYKDTPCIVYCDDLKWNEIIYKWKISDTPTFF